MDARKVTAQLFQAGRLFSGLGLRDRIRIDGLYERRYLSQHDVEPPGVCDFESVTTQLIVDCDQVLLHLCELLCGHEIALIISGA